MPFLESSRHRRVIGEGSHWQRQVVMELGSERGMPPSWKLLGTPKLVPAVCPKWWGRREGAVSCSFFLPRSRQTDGKVTHRSPAASLCLGTTAVGPAGAGVPKTVRPGVRCPPFGAQAAAGGGEPVGLCCRGKPEAQERRLWPMQLIFNYTY